MGVLDVLGAGARKIFGSRNERLLKRYNKHVESISTLEDEIRGDFDARFEAAVSKLPEELGEEERPGQMQALRVDLSQDLRERTDDMKKRLAEGEPVESVLPEAFAVMREASRRAQDHRHFDCQLVGGQVLYEGKIAEMKTGEGKTIVCHLAAFLKCLHNIFYLI